MRTNWCMTALVTIFALLLAPATSAVAADAKGDEAALQKRLRARYPQVRQLKVEGVIGETSDGYVDVVPKRESKAAAELVGEENADRRAAYKLIADKEGVDVDVVARRAGKRNFERADAGEWLKEGGKWKQKAAK